MDPHHESGHSHFLITEDIFPLMQEWGRKRNFTVPDVKWFARNHQRLQLKLLEMLNHNGQVAVVDSFPYYYIIREMLPMIYKFVGNSVDLGCAVSLDNVYTPNLSMGGAYPIQLTRAVDIQGRDIGRVVRPFAQRLEDQVSEFISSLDGGRKLIVIDDGIWTGGTIRETCRILSDRGLEVVAVVVGIRIQKKGISFDLYTPIHAVQVYREDSRPVLDWVCERDFFPGVPFGGRTVVDNSLPGRFLQKKITAGAYYIEKPEWLKDWASIEDLDYKFSNFCVTRSIELFEKIEELSGRPVLFGDLTRVPFSLINEQDESKRVADLFRGMLK